MRKFKSALFALLLWGTVALFAEPLAVSFQRGAWSQDQWTMVKSPRWENRGSWQQLDDAIVNVCPADATDKEMMGPRAAETYTSMLWKEPVKGNFTMSSTMSFQYRMAPLFVLTKELGADATGYPEYREHWEVVLYDDGINVWHHEYSEGKPHWHLAASAQYKFQPETKYTLKLQVQRFPYGARVTVSCGDAKVVYTEHGLPETLFVGITGCEGPCKFYDFTLDAGR